MFTSGMTSFGANDPQPAMGVFFWRSHVVLGKSMGSFCELFIPRLAIETGEIWNTPEHSHLQKNVYVCKYVV